MALAATTVWEVQSGGSDTNGGGYVATGTDYSQQAAAQLTLTNVTCTGNTTLTDADAGGSFTDAMIGNILYLSNGPGWYQIISKTDTDNIVVDRVGPTDTGMTCNVGGALATLGGLGQVLAAHGVRYHQAYIKTGTYNLANVNQNVSGGSLDLSVGNMVGVDFYLECYEITRGNLGTSPKFDCNGNLPSNGVMIKMQGASGAPHTVVNLHLDGDDQNVIGFLGGSRVYNNVVGCLVEECNGTDAYYRMAASDCKALNCDGRGFFECDTTFCWADACTGYGFYNHVIVFCCIASNGYRGFYSNLPAIQSVAYGNSNYGFQDRYDHCFANNISYGNGTYGYFLHEGSHLINCASGGNASGRKYLGLADFSPIALTADPFIDAAGGDFRLNNVPDGGLLCKAAGLGVYGQSGSFGVGAIPFQESSPGSFSNQWAK